jgi:hypothetical protein
VHGALNVAFVETEKFMLIPVERATSVGTTINICIHTLPPAHNKYILQSFSLLQRDSPAAGILQIVKPAQDSALCSDIRHITGLA